MVLEALCRWMNDVMSALSAATLVDAAPDLLIDRSAKKRST